MNITSNLRLGLVLKDFLFITILSPNPLFCIVSKYADLINICRFLHCRTGIFCSPRGQGVEFIGYRGQSSYSVCDLCVECSEEFCPPDLCGSVEDLKAVVEVEVHLTCHLYL